MTSQGTDSGYKELREKLAAIEHERWSDWQKWCHQVIREHGKPSDETDYVLGRWDRQIATKYEDLSYEEKASDMEQVDRYWPLILELIATERRKAAIEEHKILDELAEQTANIDADRALDDYAEAKEKRLAELKAALSQEDNG
jgi:hypothetical protein